MEASWVSRSRALRFTLFACAAIFVPAASASAAYAPQLQISFSPATPGKPVAITSHLTQAPGETPSKTVKVSFPVGFSPNLGAKATICTPADPAVFDCPATSKIGTAVADAEIFGEAPHYDGVVYFGGPVAGKVGSFQLLIRLISERFGDQNIVGLAQLRPDGGYDTIFDNLPNALVRNFTLALSGDGLALLQTPQKCGNYKVQSAYTSQNGETGSQTIPFKIAGCAVNARATTLGLSRSGVASFALSAAGKTTVSVTRGGQLVKRRTIQGKRGTNRVQMGKLRAGRYSVSVVAPGGNIARRNVTIGK